jgi:APA family basic amino acid/polyamine antiporter
MMYYLLTQRPLQSLVGILIMLSALLIYAVFHKRAGQGPVAAAPGRE